VVGNAARQMLIGTQRTVYSVKRLMGRVLADVREGGRPFSLPLFAEGSESRFAAAPRRPHFHSARNLRIHSASNSKRNAEAFLAGGHARRG